MTPDEILKKYAPAAAPVDAPTQPSPDDILAKYAPRAAASETVQPTPDDILAKYTQAEAAAPQPAPEPQQPATLQGTFNPLLSPQGLEAMNQGFRNTIGARVINSASPLGVAYKIATGNELIPRDENYHPAGAVQNIAYYGTNLVADPANLVGGAAASTALKATGLADKTTRLAALSLASRSTPMAAKLTTSLGMKSGALAGAAAGGTVSALESLATAGEEGEIDPITGLTKIAVGTGLGGALGGLAGRYAAGRENKALASRKLVQDAYEGNVKFSKELERLSLAQGTDGIPQEAYQARVNQNKQEMLGLHNKITVSESAQKVALERAGSATTAEEATKWQNIAAKHNADIAEAQNAFNDKFGGEAYDSLMQLKRAYGKTQIKVGGKLVDAFDHAISRHGVVIDPETAKVVNALKDKTSLIGQPYMFRDPVRMIQEVEGMGGPVQRVLFDPLSAGNNRFKERFVNLEKEFEQKARAAGIKRFTWTDRVPGFGNMAARDKSARMVDVLEGRLDISKLEPAEQHVVNYMKVTYENLLNEMNSVRIANNLAPIPKRTDYFPHMVELNRAVDTGVDLGTSAAITSDPALAGKIKMRFEKARTGDAPYAKDVYTALTSYASSAYRTIHLTQARNQALALTELMDNAPQLQAKLTQFLNGPKFGGVSNTDAALLNHGMGWLVDTVEHFGRAFGRGTIPGNLKILIDQASQTLPTAAITGPRYAAEGIAGIFGGGAPESARAASPFLNQRGIAKEAGAQFGRAQRNLVGSGLNKVEGLTRGAMEGMDSAMANFSWTAAFRQAKEKFQLSDKAAQLYADDIARSLHGIYDDLYRPLLLQSRFVKGAWPFQTFSANLFNSLVVDTKLRGKLMGTSTPRELAKMLGTMEATNLIYKNIIGVNRGPFDMGLLSPTNYGQNEDGQTTFRDKSLATFVDQKGSKILSDVLPSVGPFGFASTPAIIGKADDAWEVVRSAFKYQFDDDGDKDEQGRDLEEKLARLGSSFVSHGAQLNRVRATYRALQDGYVKLGQDEVPFSGTMDAVKGVAFGPRGAAKSKAGKQ